MNSLARRANSAPKTSSRRSCTTDASVQAQAMQSRRNWKRMPDAACMRLWRSTARSDASRIPVFRPREGRNPIFHRPRASDAIAPQLETPALRRMHSAQALGGAKRCFANSRLPSPRRRGSNFLRPRAGGHPLFAHHNLKTPYRRAFPARLA